MSDLHRLYYNTEGLNVCIVLLGLIVSQYVLLTVFSQYDRVVVGMVNGA